MRTSLWSLPTAVGLALALGHGPALAGKAVERTAAARPAAMQRRLLLAGVKTWAIQLRHIDRRQIMTAPLDLIVIDHAPHPSDAGERPFAQHEIETLKVQPGGKRRVVLAYLSIGEAERYRYYWKHDWDNAVTRPLWLGAENPHWPGDFQVKFSDPGWQSLIFGTPQSYLDRIIAAGFDGVYLDRVDAFQDAEQTSGAEDAMVGFVSRLADYARRSNPQFLVVVQNAEELARRQSLLDHVDAFAKEDLTFGADNTEAANPPQMVRDSTQYLRRAKRAGLKVFVLEYVTAPDKIAKARSTANRDGFVIHFTDRMLGTLLRDSGQTPENSESDPAPP